MNILTIGGATQDMCVYYQNQEIAWFTTPAGKQRFLLLLEGAKIELESVVYLPGGGAHNTAVAYARQGFGARIICCIGTDCQGDAVIENLKKNNVCIDLVTRIDAMSTGFSLVITLTTGDRTVLINRGATTALSLHHVTEQAFSDVNQLYITSLSGATAALLPALAWQARQRGIPVAVNPGSSQLCAGADALLHALPSINTLILNSDEALLFLNALVQAEHCSTKEQSVDCSQAHTTLEHAAQQHKGEHEQAQDCADFSMMNSLIGTNQLPNLLHQESHLDIRLFCARVHAYGPQIVVVTNGAEGVYVSADGKLYFYPSQPIKVVSTLGAGDAFGSGFVGHLMRGGTVQEALLYGIVNSHAVLSDYGAQTGLLSHQALVCAVQALDPALLQEYSLMPEKL